MNNLDRFKQDLTFLIVEGERMDSSLKAQGLTEKHLKDLEDEKKVKLKKLQGFFSQKYQSWYSEALQVIKQLLPDRKPEFEELYQSDAKRKAIDSKNYCIQDWLRGIRASFDLRMGEKHFDDLTIIQTRFWNQLEILKSAERRFQSSLFDVKQLLQADLFDSELDAARELSKKGFFRAAGIICGVILEKHLQQVTRNHKISISKKLPTISDFLEALKNNNVIDIPMWRNIQRLADIRNLCGHNKEREPNKEDVEELIQGSEKIIKTLY